jgi:hypothetical protein
MPAEPPVRAPGPTAPGDIRSDGDLGLAAVLEDALRYEGRVERASHGFHAYPAGMHPDAARAVISAHPGAAVHDPFCGGGTVLVEALLNGRAASGTDLSPIATLVTTARTSGPEHAGPLRSTSRRITDAARLRTETVIPEVCADWYEPHVADEIGRLRDGILAVEDAATRVRLFAVLSSIVVKASFRESDTANRRQTTHRPPGTTAILFHKKARELGRMLDAMPQSREVLVREADASVVGPPPGTGLVLTSPPYPGVYDYLPMQQLRYAWLDVAPRESAMAAELGSRRSFRARGRREAFKVWREDTARWIAAQARTMAPGARLAVNVGDGLVGGRLVDSLAPTLEAMQRAGLEVVARASADRPDHARDSVRVEHIALAEKPGA